MKSERSTQDEGSTDPSAFTLFRRVKAGRFVLFSLAYSTLLGMPFILFLLAQAFGELKSDGLVPGFDLSDAAYRVIIRLSIFTSAASFGALGAAISAVSRMRLPFLRHDGITYTDLFCIQTIGAVFALILTLIFMGQMIAGSLFPSWDPFYRIIYSAPAFAKLLVWSFIAGFFERFVPRVLENLTRKSNGSEDDGRERPASNEVRQSDGEA